MLSLFSLITSRTGGCPMRRAPSPAPPQAFFRRFARLQLQSAFLQLLTTWWSGLPHLKYQRGRPSLVASSLFGKEGHPCPFLLTILMLRQLTTSWRRFSTPPACPSP